MARRAQPQIEGKDAILRSITAKAAAAKNANLKLVVGYEAEYAVHVHERLDLYHEPPTQAKFLEQPGRELAFRMGKKIADLMKAGVPMKKAMLEAGMMLQEASQKIVPIDTGNLRASAFTRVEKVT